MTQAPDEREAIVRWLRAEALSLLYKSDISPHDGGHEVSMVNLWADAIERGEHLDHLSEQGEGYE